jgi:signal transduction histidine kinase
MKRQRSLMQRYQSALQKHLRPGTRAHAPAARRLGDQAAALGMETLEFARIHDRAFSALKASTKRDGALKRAQVFFNDAIAPIMETHPSARESKTNLNQLEGALSRRTLELAAANRQLQLGITQRGTAEAALEKKGAQYAKVLNESLHIQQGLRKLTHKLLAAQENERKGISQKLREEIAQTLLAINVRLVSLKNDAKVKGKNLNSEITSTQKLVKSSATSIRRAANEFRKA